MEATFDRRPQADDDEATNVAEVADIVAPPNDVASAQASSDTSASGWDYEAALRPKRTMRVALIGLTAATMALVGALLYAVYHKDPLPTPIIAAGAVTVHHPSDEDTAIPADGRITLVVEDVHVGDASMAAKTPAAKAVQPRSNVGAAGRTHSRRVRTPAKRRAWHSPSAKRPLKWSTLRVQAPLPGEVLLDGQPLGKLPLTRTPVWPGHHNLIVRSAKRGYTIRRQITVKPGAQLSLQLVPKWGSIRLHVWPWAEVRLDGRNVGTTPLAPIRALEGIHRVVLVNSKLGVRRELRVLVKPAQQTHVKVRLQRSTQP